MKLYNFALISATGRTLLCVFMHNLDLKRVYIVFVFILNEDLCKSLFRCRSRRINVRDVSATFGVTTKKVGILYGILRRDIANPIFISYFELLQRSLPVVVI